MVNSREAVRSASISIMVVGFFMLFFSLAFIVVFPESEHSAFPYPLGIPGIVAIITGLSLYVLSRFLSAEKEGQQSPMSRQPEH